jgi:hypothetical protein
MNHRRTALSSLLALGLALSLPVHASTGVGYHADINAWRQQADVKIRAEDGPLAAVGLYWLRAGSNQVGAWQ